MVAASNVVIAVLDNELPMSIFILKTLDLAGIDYQIWLSLVIINYTRFFFYPLWHMISVHFYDFYYWN